MHIATFKDAQVTAAARRRRSRSMPSPAPEQVEVMRLKSQRALDRQMDAAEVHGDLETIAAVQLVEDERQLHPAVEDESQVATANPATVKVGTKAARKPRTPRPAAAPSTAETVICPGTYRAGEPDGREEWPTPPAPQPEPEPGAALVAPIGPGAAGARLARLHTVAKCRVSHPCGHPGCKGKMIAVGAPWFWWTEGGKEVYRCAEHEPAAAELVLPARKAAPTPKRHDPLIGLQLVLEDQRLAIAAESGARGSKMLRQAVTDRCGEALARMGWGSKVDVTTFRELGALYLANAILAAEG